MFRSIKSRLIASLATALLFFAAGSAAMIFQLIHETSRFEALSRDAVATANERLPLLLTLEKVRTTIRVVRVEALESIAAHHSIETGLGADVAGELLENFWVDTASARSHAEALGMTDVVEGIEGIRRSFPVFYEAANEIVHAYRSGSHDGVGDQTILIFTRLGHILDGSIEELPRIAQQITQRRLMEAAEQAASVNRQNSILLRIIVGTTFVGGMLALAASIYLFRLLTTQYQHLRTERDRAEVATRAKTEFLYNMSHELRTPLNAIIGFSQIMENETLGPVGNPNYQVYATDIRESGEHLLSLINDILDLSKIDSGKIELIEETLDISSVTRATVKLLGPRAEQRKVTLELDVAGDLPPLFADERKVKQILVNLLSNAVKFTDTGGTVRLKVTSEPDAGYVFEVRDSGIGMSEASIAKALTLFGQVDGDLNRQYDGTGLGLPLSVALTELHGGRLEVASEVDVGTSVTVWFPAERIGERQAQSNVAALAEQIAS